MTLNLNKLFRSRFMLKKYHKYISEPDIKFAESVPAIENLFKSAGLEDPQVTHVESVGFGHFQKAQVSVFRNLTNRREDVVGLTIQMLHKAIGIYRGRAIDAINPFYWIELVITLPKQIFSYLGIPPEKTSSKIVQVLYWIISGLLSLVYAIFKEEIHQYIRDFLL